MRLRHPEQGTVVEVGEDLESMYLARGWVDADQKRPRRRAQKDDDADASGRDLA